MIRAQIYPCQAKGSSGGYQSSQDVSSPVNRNTSLAGVLFLVEGCGQGSLGKNWGDGIATDPQIISSRGLSDPNPFFSALLEKPYIDQIIIGPHVYPPSISMAQEEISVSMLYLPLNAPYGLQLAR